MLVVFIRSGAYWPMTTTPWGNFLSWQYCQQGGDWSSSSVEGRVRLEGFGLAPYPRYSLLSGLHFLGLFALSFPSQLYTLNIMSSTFCLSQGGYTPACHIMSLIFVLDRKG